MRLHPQSFAMAALLTALVAVAPLSTDMYLPALPTIGGHFGASTSDVQLTLSAFLIGFAVAQLIVGPLSDRIGRRPVMIGGVFIFVLTSFACMMADTITMLIIARFFRPSARVPVVPSAVPRCAIFTTQKTVHACSPIWVRPWPLVPSSHP